jgi:hypothetical protein
MGIKLWKAGLVLSAITLSPAISLARVESCASRPGYNTGTTSRTASRLFREMRRDARRVAYQTLQIQSFTSEWDTTWAGHADRLNQIKAEVDDMGKRLCRLETMQSAQEPREQKIVAQVAPLVQEMADNTDAAINYLNAHQARFWPPSYKTYTQNLYKEARTLAADVHAL